MDRYNERTGQAVKDIYVYPLVRHARQRLSSDPTPETNTAESASPESLPESLPPIANAATASILDHFRSGKITPLFPTH
jgi:hypothetical protein